MREQTPTCPKCGYDQSGEIATWESYCPVEGQCPECGIVFAWGSVFRPLLNDLSWYSEHAKSLPRMIWRTPRTLWKLILPHRFWREVDVTKRVSIRRLLVWVIFVLVAVHLLVAIPHGIGYFQLNNWPKVSVSRYYQLYGGHGIAKLVLDGIFAPFVYTQPSSMGYVLSQQMSLRQYEDWYREIIRPMIFQLGFIALWLAVLLAIPHTRRIAKLRRAHIARAALLSGLAMVLTFEFMRLCWAMYGATGHSMPWLYRYLSRGIVPTMCVWQIVFWASAVGIGWRVRPWKLLVALGTLAALLGGTALRVYVFLASTR